MNELCELKCVYERMFVCAFAFVQEWMGRASGGDREEEQRDADK